jgi:6-phosphofructokinase 2
VKPARVVTLTLNPAIDISSQADEVRPTHKVRTSGEEIEPGGGGINVARVLRRLDVDVCAMFLAGGMTGKVLDALLERAGIERREIGIAGDTRISLTVVEHSTGNEYRFVPEGPEVSEEEADEVLAAVAGLQCNYFVASGSLPRGLNDAFYAEIGHSLSPRTRFVVDTSGAPLKAVLDAGGIFLVKPSRGEFEAFAGRSLSKEELCAEAAKLVASRKAENVAITLGQEGAVFANADGAEFLPAIAVRACSAVGAGDSFLAGIVYGFASGRPAHEAFRLGLAAGAAAVLSCGSELAKAEDLERLMASA